MLGTNLCYQLQESGPKLWGRVGGGAAAVGRRLRAARAGAETQERSQDPVLQSLRVDGLVITERRTRAFFVPY